MSGTGTTRGGEREASGFTVDRDVARILSELQRQGVTRGGLAADSRAVARGDVFLAYPGARTDGRRFVADAVARGAAAVLWERDGFAWPTDVARAQRRRRAAARPRRPARRRGLRPAVASGCGSSASPAPTARPPAASGSRRRLPRAGRKCGGDRHARHRLSRRAARRTRNTTPDAVALQRALARFVSAGAQAVAMEVSSIGLDQGRVDGVRFACALFTNLSRDHLDYHGDMERYAQAKTRLFRSPGLAHAVLNLDDALGVRIAQDRAGTGVARDRLQRRGRAPAQRAASSTGSRRTTSRSRAPAWRSRC